VQIALWNFVKYNVVGGGDSALYGVESSTYYLRNAFTNLNLVLPLALLAPLSALFLMMQSRGEPYFRHVQPQNEQAHLSFQCHLLPLQSSHRTVVKPGRAWCAL
jgi:hypothetical protein